MLTQGVQSYFLVNKKADNALDLSGSDKKSLIGFYLHAGNNQKWIVNQRGDYWTLRNVETGSYLSIEGEPSNGTPVIGGNNETEWDIRPDERDPSVYRIVYRGTDYNVDLSDHGNATPGTKVTLWNAWQPGDNQCWRMLPSA